MNRNILSILALAFVLVFVGCSKEEIFDTDQNIKEEAGVIKFGVDSEATRTIYGTQTDGNWPVYWTAGDKIRVFCNAALEATKDTSGNNYADYTVNGDGTASRETITAANEKPLKWNYGNGHKFFAVYPGNNNNITVGSDGVAEFPINRNQRAIISTTNGYSQDVVAKADMNNQYMVAYSEKNPADLLDENGNSETVWLTFKPLMTTLDVVITANSTTSQNSGSVRITGISLASTMTTTSSSSKDVFFYDINETNIDNSTIVADPNAKVVTAQTITEQTFVNLVDANGNASYVDLAAGHKLTVTIFLPPMSKAAAANLKRQCKVRVHATGSNELVASIKTNIDASSETWTTQLTPSVKKTINLPALPTTAIQDANGNNWITPLDGNIYVSQMSIPGAHDAATGEEMATIVGDIFASTQEQTLDKQWTLGVRAFDLRPAIYTKYNNVLGSGEDDDELWLYHGMTRVAISWASAMSTLKSKLTENSGEFAIVLFRHEDEGIVGKDNDSDRFNTFMTNYINANKDWIVDWKPNLTIDEARGKIILISRFSGSWSYGCFTGWNHDAEGTTTTIRNADSSKSATMYVQDYYNPSSHDTKWTAIQKYLDVSKTLHTDDAKINHWCINHASGYVGSSTSDTYRNNAAAQNPKLISYITSATWVGSTGIMLFDYAGASLSNGFLSGDTEVYGDVALQTIIDNNYKYRMKRRGEN